LVIVLSVPHQITPSDNPFGIFWSLYFLFFLKLRLLITPLVSFGHCIVCFPKEKEQTMVGKNTTQKTKDWANEPQYNLGCSTSGDVS
jgi:hypothetical protein